MWRTLLQAVSRVQTMSPLALRRESLTIPIRVMAAIQSACRFRLNTAPSFKRTLRIAVGGITTTGPGIRLVHGEPIPGHGYYCVAFPVFIVDRHCTSGSH